MFSALSQGSLVHILDKTDGLKYKTGEIIGVKQNNTYPNMFGNPNFPNGSPITLSIKVDGEVREYPEIPGSQTIMSYNNGKFIISETKQGIQSEVENVHQNSKQILANREYYEKLVKNSESIMSELNPQFAQDKERDDRINNLDTKVTSIESKLDKILNAVTSGNPTIKL